MPTKRKVNKLSDLSIDEVSFVDRGANQHADVVIHKRDEDVSKEGAPSDLKNSDENAKDCTACDGKGEVPDGVGDIKACEVCGGSGEVSKADPSPSDVHIDGDVEDDTDEDEEERPKTKDKKSIFKRMIDSLSSNEFTTSPNYGGTISHMSEDVEKAGGMNLPWEQQMQGQPAPGPQGAMPPGGQAFPAGGQPPMDPNAMGGQMPPGMMQQGQPQPGQMQAGPPLPQEVVQYIQQLEQALAEAQGQQASPSGQEDQDVDTTFGKNIDHLDEDEAAFLQELAKNLEDEDMREQITKAQDLISKANERAEAAEEIAKAERDHRLTQDYIAKARSYVNLPVSADDFGPVLKRLEENMEEEDVALITKAISAANETVANIGAFTEVGKRGIENYESVSKVDSRAKELVEKNDGMTMEQARTQVLEESPDLYDDYLRQSESR